MWHHCQRGPLDLHAALKCNICHVHIYQRSDSGIPLAYIHTHMHTVLTWTYYNIRLTGVQQDDIEDGHSKKNNNSKQNNTECNHSWEEVSWSLVSYFWTCTRPWGSKLTNQCQSTGPKSTYVKLVYNAMIQQYGNCYTLYSICTAAPYINKLYHHKIFLSISPNAYLREQNST